MLLFNQKQRRLFRQSKLKQLPLLKSSEAAEALRISRQALFVWIKKEYINAYKVGHQYMFNFYDIQKIKRDLKGLNWRNRRIYFVNKHMNKYIKNLNDLASLPELDKLKLQLKDMPLSTHLKKCLAFDNIDLVFDAICKTRSEHLRTPRLGYKSVHELMEFLKVLGFDLEDYDNMCKLYDKYVNIVKGV